MIWSQFWSGEMNIVSDDVWMWTTFEIPRNRVGQLYVIYVEIRSSSEFDCLTQVRPRQRLEHSPSFLPNLHFLPNPWPCSTFAPSSRPHRSWTNHTSGKRSSLDMIPDLQLFPFLPEIKFAKVTQFHNEWRWPVFQWISAKILLQQSKAFPPIQFHLHKGTTVLGSSGENGTYWLFHAQLFHFHDDNHQSYPLKFTTVNCKHWYTNCVLHIHSSLPRKLGYQY